MVPLCERTTVAKLNDTQLILLSAAAARENGSLIPLPPTIADAGVKATNAIAALLKRGLAEEHETNDNACVHRTDGDLRYGVFLTPAGAKTINVGEASGADQTNLAVKPPTFSTPKVTKSATVVALLQRGDGATLAELISATGWLPHTTRAALTGLRKKGHVVDRSKRGTETCYRIASA